MIKIKVFSVRQAINSLIYAMLIFTLIVFVIFIIISSSYFLKEYFETTSIIEKDFVYETFSREKLINEIYSNEFSYFSFENVDNGLEDDKSQIVETKKENDNAQKNTINVDVVEKHKYSIPDRYDTQIYSNGKVRVGNSFITNYSTYTLDLDELSKPLNLKINLDTTFLLFHTHTTESYTFKDNINVNNYRTTDKNYNMVSVGKMLFNSLKAKGFNCVHDESLHDYPSYNGAYKSSLATIQEYLKNKKYDFVIDVHRDALSSNLGYRPTVEIEGTSVAKLMFVVGTDACGLSHSEWMKNLKLALMIQNRANEMYPGFFRDLNLSKSRYNQHISNGAFIIEVGATGNSLEEAQNAMKYLANVIDSFME